MDAFQDLNDLYFFAKVVDCGSLYGCCRGARHADLEAQSTDRGALEKELGVRLLNRTTRKTIAHRSGPDAAPPLCVELIAEAEAARDAINQRCPHREGLVRLSCPTGPASRRRR